jgi:ATP-dependent helicase HepA
MENIVDLKIGMYVRCSIEEEHEEAPRRFALGQISHIDSVYEEVDVRFFLPSHLGALRHVYQVPESKTFLVEHIQRVKILPNTEIYDGYMNRLGTLISFSHEDSDGIYYYYVRKIKDGQTSITVLPETQIRAFFTRADADVKHQMMSYELHNPIWYLQRQIVAESVHSLKNAAFGFETLIGSRVFLLPHQVDTIIRAITASPCRFMLADEVGLGKTIEAAVIIKGLQKRLGDIRTLLIVPQSLLYQWQNELSYKFWTEFTVYKGDGPLPDNQKNVIFPLEALHTSAGKALISLPWDLCVVDETHRLLRMNEEYEKVLAISRKIEHLLLLSATPIQSRHEEFLKLAILLEPQKYRNMPMEQFLSLLDKQEYLRKKVYRMMRDLYEYEEEELAEEYAETLEEIAERIADDTLLAIVRQIDPDAEDQGLAHVQLALAYIAEHYQLERKIIRHRRKELNDRLPKRSFFLFTYEMQGSDEGFDERETYEATLEYLEYMNGFDTKDGAYARLFLSAMFSSPYALLRVLQARENIIQTGKCGQTEVDAIMATATVHPEEAEYLRVLRLHAERWMRGTEREKNNLQQLYDDPDLIKGRLLKVFDYISAYTVDEKMVIFSSWKETILPLEQLLIQEYGPDAVASFYTGKSDEALQEAVDRFQRDTECRFMLCDSLGGEGRNFQMADQILHIDIPWSPTDLEQRIGRLDRIGRKGDVMSVVFCSENTVEYDLFTLWNEGLRIFEESISGIEIAIREIQDEAACALSADIRYGLRDILPQMQEQLVRMREKVEEERYFDMARQLDKYVQDQLMKLIQTFDEENGCKLAETMLKWASVTGLRNTSVENGKTILFLPEQTFVNSMKKTLFLPPNMDEARKRAKRTGEVRGTFNREVAVHREDLIFFAPGDPFFDAIVNNAYEMDSGRATAFAVRGADIDWEGFLFTWSVIPDPNPLLALCEPLENIVLSQGYAPLHYIRTLETLYSEKEVEEEELLAYLQHIPKSHTIHLGERGNGALSRFREAFPPEQWRATFEQAYAQSEAKVQQQVQAQMDIQRARHDFQKQQDARKAARLYYGAKLVEDEEDIRFERIYEALLVGLKNPVIRLESAAYIRMVKKHG